MDIVLILSYCKAKYDVVLNIFLGYIHIQIIELYFKALLCELQILVLGISISVVWSTTLVQTVVSQQLFIVFP